MYLCYVDESGTPDVPGNTSHYVLAGLAIPADMWKQCDHDLQGIRSRYGLGDSELHVAWLLRAYLEQDRVPQFAAMSPDRRRTEVTKLRNAELLRQQRAANPRAYRQVKNNYQKTTAYIHLTREERAALVVEVADTIRSWASSRLFAECVDKLHFDPARTGTTVEDQAFEQVVSRFEAYLASISAGSDYNQVGLLIHDNNQTVARRHTGLMKRFHDRGTQWRTLHHVVETPLFVDSELTGMVQVADLCCYALRRYLENGETGLFERVFSRADRKQGTVVGVRHFTHPSCACEIRRGHRP